MDIYDQAHRNAMFMFCDDNNYEFDKFCRSYGYQYDDLMLAFCQRNESQYIDFLQHYDLF